MITATNTGGQAATGVTVTAPLPASAVFGSATATQGTCTRTPPATGAEDQGRHRHLPPRQPGRRGHRDRHDRVTPTTPGTLTGATTGTATNLTPDPDDTATATTTTTVQGT